MPKTLATSLLPTPIAVAKGGTGVTLSTGTIAAVLSTSPTIITPTITTSATVPLVIGGTGTTQPLTLRSTSGIGAAGADIIFQVGNNGATEAMRILNSGNVGIGTIAPTSQFHIDGTTTVNAKANFSGTINSSNISQQQGINNTVVFNPSGASLATIFGTISRPTISASATIDITTVIGVFNRVDTVAGYTNTIANGVSFYAANPSIGGSKPISSYSGFTVEGFTNGNGITTGSVVNYGLLVSSFTAAGASGGTVTNQAARLSVPSGSGAGTTTNYGLVITGNGGTGGGGTTTNYALFSNSTAASYFAGNVGIGTTAPNYKLEVSVDSAGKPGAGGVWTVVSDERLKTNIQLADLDICYDNVKNIPLKRFTWKDDCYTNEQVSDRTAIGWIAQDVQKVYPKAVGSHDYTKPTPIDAEADYTEEVIEDCLDLNSGQLIAAMYGAIQKLQKKVELLELN